MSDSLQQAVLIKVKTAKKAAKRLAVATSDDKNEALLAMANALWEHRIAILAANSEDVAAARAAGTPEPRIDRLALTEKRVFDMVEALRELAELPDPVGTILETIERPNGLHIEKVRVPFGVIAMIYESRPNVTVDAAGLALKTGNAAVLRGGKEALRSNQALAAAMQQGLHGTAVPRESIQLIDRTERESVDILIRAKNIVDLVIPRGGAGLIQRVVENSLVPVIETGVGICHVYVDASANLDMASRIVINAKCQRPSVCNAIETVLVHEQAAREWLPRIVQELQLRNVEVRVCEHTQRIMRQTSDIELPLATDEDWQTEYLDLTLAIKVVSSLDEAIEHIETYGTRHSEAIVTDDIASAKRFLAEVDAAAVYHNASTRFTDGFAFGFGAEIGISTQKLHARGPMGLRELTSYKYVIQGTGQIRQ